MNIEDKITFVLNEADWNQNIVFSVFNLLAVKQSMKWDKHQWFKLTDVYIAYAGGFDMRKLLKDGTVEAILKDHPNADVKKGYARLTKKYYDSERKRMGGAKVSTKGT